MAYRDRINYHFKPAKGWINDPNGLVYFHGKYHVFYQSAPEHESCIAPMYWGHAVTEDFLHWEHLPPALIPGDTYDRDGCWSGTAIVKNDTLYLAYASIRTDDNWKSRTESVSIAYSHDGIHFTKVPENPVIPTFPADGSPDFRDPALLEHNGKIYLIMASGNRDNNTANLLLYSSEDMIHWKYNGVACSWENALFTECPSFVPFGERYLLSCSVCRKDGHAFSLQVATFDNGELRLGTEFCIDRGPDQYAGQIFTDPFGRTIMLSWIPGWEWENKYGQDIGCLSVPKEILWKDGKLLCYPIKEMHHLLKDSDPAIKKTDSGFILHRQGKDPVVHHGKVQSLAVLRDGYVMEIFVNDGETVYTAILPENIL